MESSASKYGNYIGLLAAVLYIVAAFVMMLDKGDSTSGFELSSAAKYVLIGAGVLAAIAGVLLLMKDGKFIEKIAAILLAVVGIVSVAVYFLVDSDMEIATIMEIFIVVAILAMAASIGAEWVRGLKGLMDIAFLFTVIEVVFLVLIFMDMSIDVASSAAVLVIGFWMAAELGLSMTAVVSPAKAEIDPTRKSAKRAQKEQSKKDEEAKKQKEREEKLEAHKKQQEKQQKHDHKKDQVKKEEQPKKEEPKAQVKVENKAPAKEEPVAAAAAATVAAEEAAPAEPVEQKPNNDFMSKLVSSKEANKAAKVSDESAAIEVAEPEPVQEAPVAEPEPVQETPVAEPEPVKEEPVVEPEPVQEAPVEEPAKEEVVAESVEDAAPAAGAAVAAAVVASTDDEDEDEDEELEDIFTDYSPEALVRRAAWNKGLRCRRDYGEYHIPVAFVKGKVAVYVEDPAQADTKYDSKLEEEGWVVIRYDINSITDGLDQGAEIATAVKANLRAQKAAKKKKKPAKK